MGNFLRRSGVVHPAYGDGGDMEEAVVAGKKKVRLRIKVKMRRDKLEELLCVAHRGGYDQSDGGDKIGFLILKECMEGRLPARVLASGEGVSSLRCGNILVSRRLDSIKEE